MRHVLFLALTALALLAQPLGAQDVPSPYRYVEPTQSLGAFAGWMVTDEGDRGIGPHSAPIVGARYTVRFTGPLSGELGLATVPGQRTVFQRGVQSGDTLALDPVDDVSSLLLLGEAGLRFNITGPRTWNDLAPYVSLGIGGVWDVLGESDVDATLESSQRVDFGPAFAVGVGAGTDWFLSERLAARVEARDYLWRLETPEGLTASRQTVTEWTNNVAITLGLSLYF